MQFDDFFFEGVGSSINYRYAVNTSLVKPLTLAAGGASYALIKHPEGLKCDSRQWSLGPQRLVFCVWSSCLKLTQKLFEDKTYRHTEISSSNPSILPNLRFGVLGCFRYIFLGGPVILRKTQGVWNPPNPDQTWRCSMFNVCFCTSHKYNLPLNWPLILLF